MRTWKADQIPEHLKEFFEPIVKSELGREKTPEEFVSNLVSVFGTKADNNGVWRVLRDDGILFVNLGDTYSGGGGYSPNAPSNVAGSMEATRAAGKPVGNRIFSIDGIQQKELIGVPWMLAFAMRKAGWILRQEIIWCKALSFGERYAEQVREKIVSECRKMGLTDTTAARLSACVAPMIGACMPQSVTDRCTTSHEHVFMFTKRGDYFADMEAVKEESENGGDVVVLGPKSLSKGQAKGMAVSASGNGAANSVVIAKGRNLRSVWFVVPEPYGGDHFAAYPTRLVLPMIKIGTSERGCCPECGAPVERVIDKIKLRRERPNDFVKRTGENGTGNFVPNSWDGATRTKGWRPTCRCAEFLASKGASAVPCRVLDPFGGTATTAVVANSLGHDATIIELFPEYLEQAKARVAGARFEPPPDNRKGLRSKPANRNQMALFEATP